tara:strand:- start:874 stop:1653 length:780 start_codon:yes stop_codon:yes gene_type:complete
MTLIIDSGYTTTFADADVQAYLTAVETADNQALEYPVAVAINDFVVGCKADGIWTAIKASCILAGARTLAGALVPLVGPAPDNIGPFVQGDYNRKTGPLTDSTSKYLDSKRAGNADPQDNMHMAAFLSQNPTATFMGTSTSGLATRKLLYFDTNAYLFANNGFSSFPGTINFSTGFIGLSRSNGSSYTGRAKGTTYNTNTASNGTVSTNIYVFAENRVNIPIYGTSARGSFYSIGESINLTFLESRVTALINAFAAAIP